MTPITIVPFIKRVDVVILNPLLAVLFAVATLYFIYAIIKLIASDGKGKAEARASVMWSLVGMFIMISVYGIINLVINTFQITDATTSIGQGKLPGN